MGAESGPPRVETVIVTWNKKEYITLLLEQLRGIDYPRDRFGVVVVDNDSTDGTVEAIEASFPEVTLIKNSENLGGAGGFNAGMRWVLENKPSCEYLWLLDNDVFVDKDALKELVVAMSKNPGAAICGSKIMNSVNPNELIEVGAFIDYNFGEIRQNLPEWRELQNPGSIFTVDYVAACSLLARTEYVRREGVWHQHLFIYWDDMEWGARFNALGYKVLACNSSIVYHPSWAERNIDNSAVWRNYYRTRNSLWFFNNYCKGFKRRRLLAKMLVRFVGISARVGLSAYPSLSKAFLDGIEDFLRGSYGKKEFHFPSNNLSKYLEGDSETDVCVFLVEANDVKEARKFLSTLLKNNPNINLRAIVPKANAAGWETICSKERILTYRRLRNGAIPWWHKFRILHFLKKRPWTLLITSTLVPKMGSIWGRDVARVDFQNGEVVAVEKMTLKDLCRLPVSAVSYLIRVLLFPPRKEVDWSKGSGREAGQGFSHVS